MSNDVDPFGTVKSVAPVHKSRAVSDSAVVPSGAVTVDPRKLRHSDTHGYVS
jgi:hypothetical protein